ncbi:MAG: hypothetical protein ACM3PS_17105 [Syntrophothermus sp.]
MQIDELQSYLFDGQPHSLAPAMQKWLVSSRHFSAFVTTFRDKIRKKLRTTRDPETLQDLRLELETAYLLLQEQPFNLVYEPQCEQRRCPDFSVTFTTRLTFMVEITRLRTVLLPDLPFTTATGIEPLADTICSKLGQLIPRHSNVLIVGVDSLHLTQSDLQAAMLRIQQRAERNDPAFWQRYRFRDRADFFRHYQRLSEVLMRGLELETDRPAIAWVNPQARDPLPGKVRTALYRTHSV